MTVDPKAGVVVPDPSQDPNAQGNVTPSVTPTPAAVKPGAPGVAQPDPNDASKTVPITALHEERDKRQALQVQLDVLKGVVGTNVQYDHLGNPVSTPTAPTPTTPGQQNVTEQLDNLWEQDPRKAMQTELQLAMQWYDGVSVQIDNQESDAMKKFPDYMTYRPEIKAYLNRLPLNQRSKNGVVDLAYYAVRGQNVDTITQKVQKDLLDKIRRGEAVQGLGPVGTASASIQPKPTQLTSEQKTAAAALGIPEDEYLKHMKA